MVVLSFFNKTELVAKDYYAQEIAYQQKIDKVNRTSALNEKIVFKTEGNTLNITFPSNFKGKTIKGSLLLFRPSDSSLDIQTKFENQTSENLQLDLSKSNNIVQKGIYRAKLDWESEGQTYYFEDIVRF